MSIITTTLSILILYLTNKHQKLLSKPLSLSWRWLGYLLLAISLMSISVIDMTSASLVFWLMQLMLQAILLPWLAFLASTAIGKNHG
ncbi:MAG: hypothetical protein MK185_14805 [Saccharospirillaceae bacterium]|nr:hypothetical protein A3759_10490 [Thalassolituus sp. HI0120]MCH2041896.1 hypothetical protein [Saccharospirillaceae bacterium]